MTTYEEGKGSDPATANAPDLSGHFKTACWMDTQANRNIDAVFGLPVDSTPIDRNAQNGCPPEGTPEYLEKLGNLSDSEKAIDTLFEQRQAIKVGEPETSAWPSFKVPGFSK